MVQCPVLKERHVELIGHQRAADVLRQRGVAGQWRQIARAAAFVSHGMLFAHAE